MSLASIPLHLPPRPLLLGAFAFVVEAFFFGCAGGARGASGFGRRRDFGEGGAQLFEAIGDVSALIAKAAARDDDLALARHAARVARAEPFLHVIGRARRGGHVPAQHRLARHLVDVLPAGAGASRELKVDFPQRDSEPLVHNEHFSYSRGIWGAAHGGGGYDSMEIAHALGVRVYQSVCSRQPLPP